MTDIQIIQLFKQSSSPIIAPVKTSTAAQSIKARRYALKVPPKVPAQAR